MSRKLATPETSHLDLIRNYLYTRVLSQFRILSVMLLVALSLECALAQRSWSPLNGWGIQQAGGYVAGRVTDAIELGDGQALGASSYSGVWWLRRNQPALPLSMSWDQPNINSLARNPSHNGSFFAGGSALYETRQGDPAPLLAPWNKVPLPPGTGAINRIVTLTSPPRIVLATDTGILWARVPVAPGPYSWASAQGAYHGAYNDVKEAAGEALVFGLTRYNPQADVGTPIRRGEWRGSGDQLALTLSSVTIQTLDGYPNLPLLMDTTSIGVCETDRTILYAAGADKTTAPNVGGMLRRFYRSGDGGRTWAPKRAVRASDNMPIGVATEGRQGDGFDNTIAVAPNAPNTVFLGWVHIQASTDGGDHFFETASLHDDHHTLFFAGPRLYDCSDGGLAYSTDLGKSFNDEFNKRLPNLMFIAYCTDALSGGRRSTVGGGLQDLSSVWCSFAGTAPPGPWKFFEGRSSGDSLPVGFVPGGAIWTVAETGVYTYSSLEPNNDYQMHTDVPVVGTVAEDTPNGRFKHMGRMFKVTNPVRRDADGRLMYDLIYSEPAYPTSNVHQAHVYGLFWSVDRGARYEHLFDVTVAGGGLLASLASYDGSTVYAGVGGNPAILTFNSTSGAQTAVAHLPGNSNTYVDNMTAASPNDVFATLTENRSTSILYQLGAGNTWAPITGLPSSAMMGVICDGPSNIYVATSTGVYASENDRTRWRHISTGLPANPSITRLVIGTDAFGKKWLYASTLGWSIWKYPIN